MDGVKQIGFAIAMVFGVGFLATNSENILMAGGLVGDLSLGAGAGLQRTDTSVPSDLVTFTSGQWGVKDHVAVGSGPTHHWIEDVLSGYDRDTSASEFLRGAAIFPNETCAVAGYAPSDPVIPVIASRSGRTLGASSQPMEALTKAADRLIATYTDSGSRTLISGAGARLEYVDVVVPKSAAPVHLALMANSDGIIWSFQIEDGAQIAGVTLIGGRAGGVLNLPEDIPLEAITDDTLEACGENVALLDYYAVDAGGYMEGTLDDSAERQPVAEAQADARTQAQPTRRHEIVRALDDAKPGTMRHRKLSFELWFYGNFSQSPRDGIAGYSDVQVVVAGDPSGMTPVQWTPPANGHLRLLNGPVYILGNSRVRSEAWAAVVEQAAERRIGVPLETTHPAFQGR